MRQNDGYENIYIYVSYVCEWFMCESSKELPTNRVNWCNAICARTFPVRAEDKSQTIYSKLQELIYEMAKTIVHNIRTISLNSMY